MSTSSNFSPNYPNYGNIPYIQVSSKEDVIKAAQSEGLKNVPDIDDVASASLGKLITVQVQELGISADVQALSFTKEDPFYKKAFIKLVAEASNYASQLPSLIKNEFLTEMLASQITEQLINEEAIKSLSNEKDHPFTKEAASEQDEKQALIPDINQVDKSRFRDQVITKLNDNDPDLKGRYFEILEQLMTKYNNLSPGMGEYDQLIDFINENEVLLPGGEEIKAFVDKYFELPQKVQDFFKKHIAGIEQRGDSKYPPPTSLPQMTRVERFHLSASQERTKSMSFVDMDLSDDLEDRRANDSVLKKTFSRQSTLVKADLQDLEDTSFKDIPLRTDKYSEIESQKIENIDSLQAAQAAGISGGAISANHKWTNITFVEASTWDKVLLYVQNIFVRIVNSLLKELIPASNLQIRLLESPVDIHYMEDNRLKSINKKELSQLSNAHTLASTALPRDENGKIKIADGNQNTLSSLKIDALHDMLRDRVAIRVGFKLFLEYLKALDVPQGIRIAEKEKLQALFRASKEGGDLSSQMLQDVDLKESLDKNQLDKLELSIDEELEVLLDKEMESWKAQPEKIQDKSREIKGWLADVLVKRTSSADSWLKQVENIEESGSEDVYENEFNKELVAYDNLKPDTNEYDQFMLFIKSNSELLDNAGARHIFAKIIDPIARVDAIVTGIIAGNTRADFFEMITGEAAIPADLPDAERLNKLTEQHRRSQEILLSYNIASSSSKKIEDAKKLLSQLDPKVYSQLVEQVEKYVNQEHTNEELITEINKIAHREPPFMRTSEIFTLYSIIKASPHTRVGSDNESQEVCGIIRDFAKDVEKANQGRKDAQNFLHIFTKHIQSYKTGIEISEKHMGESIISSGSAGTYIWKSTDPNNMQCVESASKPIGEWKKCQNDTDLAEFAAYYSTVETLPTLKEVEEFFVSLNTLINKLTTNLAESVKYHDAKEILAIKTRLEECKLGYKNLKAQIEIRSFAKELVESTEEINIDVNGQKEMHFEQGDRPIWQHTSGVYMCASEKTGAAAQNWSRVEPWQMYAKIPTYTYLLTNKAKETGDPIADELAKVVDLFRPDFKLFKQQNINPRQLAKIVMDQKLEEVLKPLGIVYGDVNKALNTTIKGFVTAYLYLKENGADEATCQTLEKIINEHTGRRRAAGQHMP